MQNLTMHEFYCSPVWYTSKDGELIMTGPQVFVTQLWISFSHGYGSFELRIEKNMGYWWCLPTLFMYYFLNFSAQQWITNRIENWTSGNNSKEGMRPRCQWSVLKEIWSKGIRLVSSRTWLKKAKHSSCNWDVLEILFTLFYKC